MNILSNLISGYNITILKLLVPVIGVSVMSIFIMLYLLLSIKTKKAIYITISITLILILMYSIISLIIIFLELYGINQQLSSVLVISNNIIILTAVILMPINSTSFIGNIKALKNINTGIFIISIVSSVLLIALSIMNCIFWHTECISVGVPLRNILIEVQEALLWHRM